MSYEPFSLGKVRVTLQPPGICKSISYEIAVPPEVWREFLRPLPREREVPFYPLAAEHAQQLLAHRKDLSEEFARIIAKGIRDALSKQDPQFGFSPEEREQINRHTHYP